MLMAGCQHLAADHLYFPGCTMLSINMLGSDGLTGQSVWNSSVGICMLLHDVLIPCCFVDIVGIYPSLLAVNCVVITNLSLEAPVTPLGIPSELSLVRSLLWLH